MKQIEVIKVITGWLLAMGFIFAIFGIYFAYTSIYMGSNILLYFGLAMVMLAAGCLVMCYMSARLYNKLKQNLKRVTPDATPPTKT